MKLRKLQRKQFDIALGALLTCYMAQREVTQNQLAKVLGASQATISRMLSGESSFDCWQLRTVAEFLKQDLNILYHDTDRVVTRVTTALKAVDVPETLKAFAQFAPLAAEPISKEA
jgi:predicted transcriptional regulator